MRRMFSKKQIEGMVEDNPQLVVNALKGQDINVEGITSKGIANTGNIGNTGDIAATGKITGGEIVENMSGYSFEEYGTLNSTITLTYVGVVKNGNKITFAIAGTYIPDGETETSEMALGRFIIPREVADKLYPINDSGTLAVIYSDLYINLWSSLLTRRLQIYKPSGSNVSVVMTARYWNNDVVAGTTYYFRSEVTFLLGENLAPQE